MSEPREYRLVWGKPLVKDDYEKLDPSIQQRIKAQFRKLQEKPELGAPCGHNMGYDLTGYRSLHFYGNKYRIIYEVIEVEKKVKIWGIGKRERGRVYRMVNERVHEAEA
jgi:mRNA-degrading endonuclease RelE of RelBE toxin-antitoxin system